MIAHTLRADKLGSCAATEIHSHNRREISGSSARIYAVRRGFMTARRSSSDVPRTRVKKKTPAKKKVTKKKATTKKKAAKKKTKSQLNREAHARKIAADQKRWAAEAKKPKKRKPAGQGNKARRAAKNKLTPVFRKPIAPDMSMYIRSVSSLTPEQIVEAKGTIVRVLSMKGNVREATDAAGIHRSQAYEWRHADEAFKEAWDDSVQEAVDRMEAELWRRGVEGYDHPVIYQGEITDSYTMYSDSLLTVLAKGNRPEKYKERTEMSTPPGQPLQLEAETKSDVISNILSMITNKPDPK